MATQAGRRFLGAAVVEADRAAPLRVDAETAIILREAYHKIEALFRADHYGLYDYVRVVAGKIARVLVEEVVGSLRAISELRADVTAKAHGSV